MAVEIKMPHLSQTTEEVRLIRWLVKEGDTVSRGEALCEVENDKTTMEVESFAPGTVLQLYGEPDSLIEAGTVIALLGEPRERASAAAGKREKAAPEREQPSGVAEPAPTAPDAASPAAWAAVSTAVSPTLSPAGTSVKGAGREAAVGSAVRTLGPLPAGVRATHLVQNIARKRGIDLARLRGSGARGLITKKDLETFLEESTARAVAPPVSAAAHTGTLSEHQAALGRNLQAAKSQIPHYYLTMRIDCEALLSIREASRRPDGQKRSLNAILLHAVARALRRHPRCNALFRSGQLQVSPEINLGLAMAADQELYVPVIRQADSKGIDTIDQELQGLLEKVQSGRLKPEDSRDGTFTVSNLGMYPVEQFTAIINPPQVAILAFGRIGRALEVDESGAIRVRSVCTVSGSFDHRALNGAQAAAFLGEVKKIIEEEL
jgi:pyruvate dehydrogenase E2 component (dihydrolipoamide acetyltransferase)